MNIEKVTIDDLLKISPTKEAAVMAISSYVACAGFLTTCVTDAQKVAMAKLGYSSSQIDEVRTGYSISYLSEIAEKMSEEHVEALLHHEKGHVVFRHLDAGLEETDKVAVELTQEKLAEKVKTLEEDMKRRADKVDVAREIQADEYATLFVKPRVLKEAIISAVKATHEVVKEWFNPHHDVPAAMAETLSHPLVKARLDRLGV